MLLICSLSFDHDRAPVVPYGALAAVSIISSIALRRPIVVRLDISCTGSTSGILMSIGPLVRGQLGPHRLPLQLKVDSHAQSPVVALLHAMNIIDQVCCDEVP